jgi:hypothetical protein
MNQSLALPQANLVAYWRFDEGAGSFAYDASGNGWTGTLINSPVWLASSVPFTRAALSTRDAQKQIPAMRRVNCFL